MIFNPDVFAEDAEVATKQIEEVSNRILEWTKEYEIAYNLSCIVVNLPVLYDVIRKTLEDLLRYRKAYNPYQHIDIPDHHKEAAHLAYWVRRLKPFSYTANEKHPANIEYQKEYQIWINEKIATRFAEYICCFGEKQNNTSFNKERIPHKLREDFLHMFRYKHISPHALMIILRSVFS